MKPNNKIPSTASAATTGDVSPPIQDADKAVTLPFQNETPNINKELKCHRPKENTEQKITQKGNASYPPQQEDIGNMATAKRNNPVCLFAAPIYWACSWVFTVFCKSLALFTEKCCA